MNRLWLFIILSLAFCHKALALEIDTEKLFLSKLKEISNDGQYLHSLFVEDSQQLYQAIERANTSGNIEIKLAPGRYYLPKTVSIINQNITIIGDSLNPFSTVLYGSGMKSTPDINNLFRVSGDYFKLIGVTLEKVGNHLIQVAGDEGTLGIEIKNCVLQDSYQQLLKVSYNLNQPDIFARNGTIENNLFRYSAGIGPNYYIGGIDAHGIINWQITHNVFDGIASPKGHIAEHAIHIWNNGAQNTVSNNLIVNSDRGIGFGMRNGHHKNKKYGHLGGMISNNIIYHANNKHPFADTGIILEDSPETNITKNIILLEHNYKNAIEYRFKQTTDVLIANNTTNKQIRSRNGGSAITLSNTIDHSKAKKAIKTKLADFIDY